MFVITPDDVCHIIRMIQWLHEQLTICGKSQLLTYDSCGINIKSIIVSWSIIAHSAPLSIDADLQPTLTHMSTVN